MKIYVISNRDQSLLYPWLSQMKEPDDWATIHVEASRKLGNDAEWVSPSCAFSTGMLVSEKDWVIISPQPRNRKADIEKFLLEYRHSHLAYSPGGGHLDGIAEIIRGGLVDVVHLSLDRLQAATGIYGVERALSQLSSLNPGVVIVVTNHQYAWATVRGRIFSRPAFRVDSAPGIGMGSAFFAAFLTVLIRDKGVDIGQALDAGHLNGSSVARVWSPSDGLVDASALQSVLGKNKAFDSTIQSTNVVRMSVIVAVIILLAGAAVLATAL